MEILIIIALNLLLYSRTYKFLLVADDMAWYLKNKKGWLKWSEIKNIHHLRMFLFDRFYGGHTFGPNVKFDHIFTTFLHTLICVLIYLAFGHNQVSFWAAILYSCNPLNNQTSIWLNGRRYAMNIIFVLGIVLASQLPHGYVYAGLLYFLTIFFQVTAVFAPVLLLYKWPLLGLLIPAIIAFKWKYLKDKLQDRFNRIKDDDRIKFTPKRGILIVKVYGHYFFKMFFPGLCAMTYPKLYWWGQTKEGNKDAYSFNWDFFIGCICLVLSIVGFSLLNGEAKFYWLFMCLSLIQWCHIIPVVQDLADRYANVPNVFAMFFLSYFVHQYAGQYAIPILVAFAAYYIPYLFTIMQMYRSEAYRWEYQRYFFPALPAPLKFECEHLIHDKQDYIRAWVLIQQCLRYGTKDFILFYQAAKCHLAVGRPDEAYALAMEAAKNYNIGHEDRQSKMVSDFLAHIPKPSRQVRRAQEREKEKKMGDSK